MIEIPGVSPETVAFWRVDTLIRALGLLSALGLPWVLLVTGLWPRVQDGLGRWVGKRRMMTAAISGAAYALAWSLTGDALSLAHRVNAQVFKFDTKSLGGWLTERLASTATLVMLGLVGAAIGYALIARSPRRWPIWGASSLVVLSMVYVVATPLLAKNAPLPQGQLKTDIQVMLRKAGSEKAPVVMRRGSGPCVGGSNLGAFPTTQVVIDDGYLSDPVDQGVEVTAHEVGHYVRHDPELGVLFGAFWICAMFGAMYWGGHYLVGKVGSEFGILELREPASLPLILFCAIVVYVAGLPVFNGVQRRIEHRADQFAMTLTHYGPAGAIGMVRDAKCSKLDPNPSLFQMILFENHPSIAQRIRFMNEYSPATVPTNVVGRMTR